MSDRITAVDALRKFQKQCDPEGIEVQVSRQALDEVLAEIERYRAALLECTMNHAEAHYIAQVALKEDSDE